MIKTCYGDILSSNATVICHQTNCLGVMGAGLALQIKNTYPRVFREYNDLCRKQTKQNDLLGKVQFVSVTNQLLIANCFGQCLPGANTDYDALKQCLTFLRYTLPTTYTIAFPYKMGCGIGGGDWNVVYSMITTIFEDYNGTVEIWDFENPPPQ